MATALLTPQDIGHDQTATTIAITTNENTAVSLIAKCSSKPHQTNSRIDNFKMEIPAGTTFVGHTNTDMDSIASAIAGAYLFDGIAASASKINSETEYCLSHWRINPLPLFETLEDSYKNKLCLVDHNQTTQMAPTLDPSKIVGIIDHHALQSQTVVNDRPIYVDIRPWGSACTIVAHTFFRIRKTIPKNIAGLLLSGILSDTLNLRSPTTTDTDRLIFAVLAKIAGVQNCDELAEEQFKAKSNAFAHLSPYEIACGDQKTFNLKDKSGATVSIGFGVCETTDPSVIKRRLDEIMVEVAVLKAEQKLDFSYLAVVDVVNMDSTLFLIGKAERELASQAFNKTSDETEEKENGIGSMELEGMVSRKKDFIPALTSIIITGSFSLKSLTPKAVEHTDRQKNACVLTTYGEVKDEFSLENCCHQPIRRLPSEGSGIRKINESFSSLATPGGGWANLATLTLPSNRRVRSKTNAAAKMEGIKTKSIVAAAAATITVFFIFYVKGRKK